MTLPVDKVQEFTDKAVSDLNALLKRLKTIFLVEDLVETLKFAVGKNMHISSNLMLYVLY